MNLFITYKGEDLSEVQETASLFREISPDIQISTMRKSKHWKRITKKYIAKADFIIYLAGNRYSDNIDWEINTAIKMGHKVHCVKLEETVALDKKLFTADEFDDSAKVPKVVIHDSIAELISLIKGDREYLRNKLFESKIENNEMLIEQYKVMLSTSESMIERRQKLTTTYLSIFSALLPVISAMLSFVSLYLYLGVILISAICIVLCFSWRSAIVSYGKSNKAKFAILEEIEAKLPTAMFASEWLALKKITSKYKSFTQRETVIPILFVAIYSVLLSIAVVLTVMNFLI